MSLCVSAGGTGGAGAEQAGSRKTLSSTSLVMDDDGFSSFHRDRHNFFYTQNNPLRSAAATTTMATPATTSRTPSLRDAFRCFRTPPDNDNHQTIAPNWSFDNDSYLPTNDSPVKGSNVAIPPKRQSQSMAPPVVRIKPVMQNGVKMSNTHYWLLNGAENQQTFASNKRSSVPFITWDDETDDSSSCLSLGTQSELAWRSMRQKDIKGYVNICPGAMPAGAWTTGEDDYSVRSLRDRVPQASQEECKVVLIGTRWDMDEAEKRLKLELLSRETVASRSHLQRILQNFNWNLSCAIDFVKHDPAMLDRVRAIQAEEWQQQQQIYQRKYLTATGKTSGVLPTRVRLRHHLNKIFD